MEPGLEAWTIARYADVVGDADRSAFLGRSHKREHRGAWRALDAGLDPPDHTRLRALVQKAFTPRMVDQLRPRILAIVGELLDRVAERSDVVDLIGDLAYPLPVVVIAELLGVPAEDRVKFHAWSARARREFGPTGVGDRRQPGR